MILRQLAVLLAAVVGASVLHACSPTSPTAPSATTAPTAAVVEETITAITTREPRAKSARSQMRTPKLAPTPTPGNTIALPSPIPTLPADLTSTLRGIEAKVIAERGLNGTPELLRRTVTTDEMAKFVARLSGDFVPSEVEILDRVWTMLGLLKPEDDWSDLYITALQSHVAGVYIPEEREILVLKDNNGFNAPEKVIYAHEYVHALQDKAFNLSSLERSTEGDPEASAALTALIEGDASLIQLDYMSSLSEEELLKVYKASSESLETLNETPFAIRETLFFPYVYGLFFVRSLFESGGWEAVDDAYTNLPASTEHIMHPQTYLAGEMPVMVDISNVSDVLGSAWEMQLESTFGEFGLLLLLEAEAVHRNGLVTKVAAAGWGGDQFSFFTEPSGNELLVSRVVWDSAQDAREFFDAYGDLLLLRGVENPETLPNRVVGTLENTVHAISIAGNETILIISTDPGPVGDVLGLFASFP